MKKFIEKLKADKKVQTAVICGCVGAVTVLAAAITIPITLNHISVKKQAAQAAVSTESVTAEITTAAQSVTEPETTQSVEATTTAPNTSAANSNSSSSGGSGSNSSKSSGGSKSSSTKSSGGSSSKSQSSGSQKPASKPADKPAQTQPAPVWTQAEVDALVAEIKAYAQSKGFAINPAKGKQGTTWSNPIHAGKDKAKTKADLKEDVDFFCERSIAELGSVTGSINVFAEKYTDGDGLPQWEVYVVR